MAGSERLGGWWQKGREAFATLIDPEPVEHDPKAGWTTLATGLGVSGFLFWRNNFGMDFSEYNLLNITCILFVPLLVILMVLRRDPAEFGLRWGRSGPGLLVAVALFLLFVPVLWVVAPMRDAQDYYLNWLGSSGSRTIVGAVFDYGTRTWSKGAFLDGGRLVYHEFVMAFYMFSWEWYHRGFLLNGLRKVMPLWGAVLGQSLLFMALHWGKPMPETLSSLPGGVLMAWFALRYRSFLPCFLLHFLVSAGFDAGVLFFYFRS
ncbi:MAG: CPBP family intramembrane glutamic endopeptidase [Capsulimonadales bacterium]|nr:CPBP family intramembrane glutamic endopeptidase [Capsulimonadales bacterium]